jgi:hypothetical protein
MGTTRFSGPVAYSGGGTKTASGPWFTNFPIGINPDYVTQFDDFAYVDFTDGDDWTKSTLTSGTGAVLADTIDGWYQIAGSGSDDTGASLQGNEVWAAQASKKIFFETRIVSSDADQMDIFVGLCENGTLATGVPFATNNQIGFLVVDEAADIYAVCDSGGTETKTDTGVDLADGTVSGSTITNSRRLGFVVSGTGMVEFYVDRVKKVTTTTNIPTSELTTWFAAVAGEATANTVTADYLLTVSSRTTDGMTQFNDQP